jgi:hypothetical protein
MKYAILLLGLISASASAQTIQLTQVTALVEDANSRPYVNCQWSVVFVNENTTPGAGPSQPANLLNGQQGHCDSAGNLSVSLVDNVNTVTPTPSQWSFSICSAPGYVPGGTFCKTNMLVTITGASQNLTSFFQPLMPLLPSGGGGGIPGGSSTQIQFNNAGTFGGITSAGTGAVVLANGTSQLKPYFDVRDWTTCNGIADATPGMSTMLAAIGSSQATVQFSGQCKLNTITFPANVTLDFHNGGSFFVNTLQTVSIVGPVIAPLSSIFFNAIAVSGSPTFTSVATDNFTRANENPLSNGGNWTTMSTAAALQLTGNLVEATTTADALNGSVWTGNSFANNQYSKITITTDSTSSELVGVVVRQSLAALTHYYAYLKGPLSSPQLALGKIVAGVNTTLLGPSATTFNTGDTLTLGVEGSTLYAYRNGTLVTSVKDVGASIASGNAGIRLQVSALANAQLANWEGGSFASGNTQGFISFAGNKPNNEYYPEWWGAVRDGSTNDVQALQAATEAADTATGGTIVLGVGKYNIGSSQWTVSSTSAIHSINIHGQGLNTTKIIAVNPTLNAIYLQHEKYSRLDSFGVDQTGTAKTGIGIAMGGDFGTGTQTNGNLLENMELSNFNWGISASGGNGTSSEITFNNISLSSNTNGFRTADSNALNFTFINLQISSNTIGVNATTTGVNVYGGAASANGDDFIFAGNAIRNIVAFRSETATNTCITVSAGDLSVINLRCSGLSTEDSHTAIAFNGGRLGIRESWIEGQIVFGAQTRFSDGNEFTLEDSTIFDGNNTYSYTSQPNGFGPGFRFSSGLNGGGRFSTRNNFHYGAGNVNLGQWPGGEGYILSPQGSSQTSAYLQYKSIGGVLTPGAGGAAANTIQPTAYIHHIGTGLIKTIDATGGTVGLNGGPLPFACFKGIADSAYTTDTTGNVSVALTAIVGQTITWCFDSGSSTWYPTGVVPVAYNHSGTVQTNYHIITDRCTLGTNCAVTLTGAAVFTSLTSYNCTGNDETGINSVNWSASSGSAFTFTGTGTDNIAYTCVGN